MAEETPDPFNEQLHSMSDAEAAEWSCRALIQSLMRPGADEATETHVALDYARRTLNVGADGLLRRAASIEDEDERIDAFGEIEFLIEGAIRIIASAPSSEIENDAPKSPTPEVENALRRRTGRPLGPRAPFIAALRKLYPDGDPILKQGMHRETLRTHVARDLGIPVESVDKKTMDRARRAAWDNVHI